EVDKTAFSGWASVKCRWGVIEDNLAEGIFCNTRLGTEHCMWRNNLVRYDGGLEGFLVECIKPGFDDVRKCIDIRIVNNTVVGNVKDGHFLRVSGHTLGLVLQNNVYVAPNLKMVTPAGSAVNVQDIDLSGLAAVANNVWP